MKLDPYTYCGINYRKQHYRRIKIPNAARLKAVKNVSTFKMSGENNPIFKRNQHDGLAFLIYSSKYYSNSQLLRFNYIYICVRRIFPFGDSKYNLELVVSTVTKVYISYLQSTISVQRIISSNSVRSKQRQF